ncbi:kinase-like protein [Mollisia scopiformis]|uniref:non-specific serine/threonine protein kinase n=1 Tax=Mollisia scopiformis TaxID=149040 RepID=A0A132BAY0_MOLSC|nr:kinase-like protein [Mollisia scopiformis]KUJ09580.1 kinase-like protein [Mollisia scopiformis]
MSLVPYSSRERGSEVVLRHNDALVLRDPQTQQLILRGATPSYADCPTCHRPLRPPSPDRQSSPHRSAAFISPEYFRMLQSAYGSAEDQSPPSSPIRRLVQPAFPISPPRDRHTGESVADAEFVTSTPAPQTGHSIKKEAFSPNYFKRFFIEEKELGRGGKGVVLLVRHELDSVSLGQFACKRVPVGDDHAWLEKADETVLIEVQLLQGLSHPNLVSYRHVWLEDVQLSRFGPTVPCAYILQQYCNSGDLLHYIIGPQPTVKSVKEQLKEQMRRRSRGQADRPDVRSSQRKLAFEEIYSFFKDITSGLAHLHNNEYIHRDLKPSNCLLHKDGNEFRCLISDFGEVQAENVVRKSTGSTGTISYCAPEVLKQDEFGRYGNFTTKSDIFSLGMILYFMCFGRLPYQSADSIQEEFEDIDLLRAEISSWSGFQDERRERPELPNQLYDFLKRLLALDPAERPSADEILTAIRTEKGLEAPSRTRHASNAGLGGRIIQSFDSPVPPSTPVNGNIWPRSSFPLLINAEPNKRRVRSGAYIEDASATESSPTPSPSSQLVIESSHSRSRSQPSHNRHNESLSLKPSITTPLLMPPPSTPMSTFKHRISLYKHYLDTWLSRNQQSVTMISKLVIFLIKMLSITKPCAPLVTREAIWWPLMALAAFELAGGNKFGWRGVVGLAVVHFAVLGVVLRVGGGLCVRERGFGEHWGWE